MLTFFKVCICRPAFSFIHNHLENLLTATIFQAYSPTTT